MAKKNEISHIQQYVKVRMQGEEGNKPDVKTTQAQVENTIDYQDGHSHA